MTDRAGWTGGPVCRPYGSHSPRATARVAPTVRTNRSYNRDRSPHPSRCACHLPQGKARAGLRPAPTADTEAVPSSRRGRTLASPQIHAARPGGRALRFSTNYTCSTYSGADAEPQQQQFFQHQGPVARRKFRVPLKFCAPEVLQNPTGTRPSQRGSGGKPSWRTKFAPAASPGDPLGTFPSLGKYLAHQGEISPMSRATAGGPVCRPYRGKERVLAI